MKKFFIFCLGLFYLGACQSEAQSDSKELTKPTVTVTTSFLKDMVQELAGDAVKLELLIPAGEDPHLYTAKASDLSKLQQANLVLYHGLHFEGKMTEALSEKGIAVSKDFPKEALHTFEEDGQLAVDPHFWFNIPLYKQAVQTTSQELQKLVPLQATLIQERTKNYLAQLDQLDSWIRSEISKIPAESRYLVTPHDAFQYLANAYGLTVHAPQGISTDSEVDNKAMIETVDLILAHKIKAIFSESTTNPDRMEKLRQAVLAKGGQVLVVHGDNQELFSDSLAPSGQKGDTYIEMYRHNIRLIVDYLK